MDPGGAAQGVNPEFPVEHNTVKICCVGSSRLHLEFLMPTCSLDEKFNRSLHGSLRFYGIPVASLKDKKVNIQDKEDKALILLSHRLIRSERQHCKPLWRCIRTFLMNNSVAGLLLFYQRLSFLSAFGTLLSLRVFYSLEM